MRPNQEKLVSVTTRIPPRDFIALSSIAKRNNKTVSGHLRWLIANNMDVYTEAVPEDAIRELLSKKGIVRGKNRFFKCILKGLFG